jgi:translation initiation factor 4A
MLSRGFLDAMNDIIHYIPSKCQIGIFSATLPADVIDVGKRLLHDPVTILVKQEEVTLSGIRQFYISVEQEQWYKPIRFELTICRKLDTLCDLYATVNVNQSVIFCNTRRKVEWLADKLIQQGFPVVSTHGDIGAQERMEILNKFITGTARVLITTDLLAR